MLRGASKHWSSDEGSLATAYPGTAKCFLWVSKLTDGPVKCSGAPPNLGAVMEAALPSPTLAPKSVFFWLLKLTDGP